MSDKSNAMTQGHALWQRVFKEVAPQYPGIEARHLYIDALALFLVQNPAQFDVIVTNNLFGDIITDLGAALQGGLGLAASGNLHPGRTSMFEPVHGSAPPLAGKNVANPMGAILSAALMLDYLGLKPEARADRGGRAAGGGRGAGHQGDRRSARHPRDRRLHRRTRYAQPIAKTRNAELANTQSPVFSGFAWFCVDRRQARRWRSRLSVCWGAG